jgi:hypothetical protein
MHRGLHSDDIIPLAIISTAANAGMTTAQTAE